ncbi:hypothetical protein C1H46_011286 [Malus baccata]|uniref:Uncharacterized protein n=1 Tax=Malus baccata TaxID=106549 RepID=A0A540MWE6_MALBA|nr:hypothetical protein C1H46_011286 [Malus baccata]
MASFVGFDNNDVAISASSLSFSFVMRPSQPPQATWSRRCCRPWQTVPLENSSNLCESQRTRGGIRPRSFGCGSSS